MFKFLICLFLAVPALGQDWGDYDFAENYLSNMIDTRMAGGTIVNDTANLFQVAIVPNRALSAASEQPPYCSGVFINDRFILTSARCALSGSDFTVYYGSARLDAGSRQLTVQQSGVIVHEEFLRTYLTGDIALMKAVDDSVPGLSNISSVRLPRLSQLSNSFLASRVDMSGWGYTESWNSEVRNLRQLQSSVVPNFYCAVRHLFLPIKSSHVCTAGLINKGPCTGDAGAPLVATAGTERVLIGVATYTPQNGCQKGKPGVFTRVSTYMDWIVKNSNYVLNEN